MDAWIFNPTIGKHTLAIIPYNVPIKSNDESPFRSVPNSPFNKPFTPEEFEEENLFDYKLTILVHTNIGKDRKHVVCPRTIGHKCPICEEQQDRLKDEDADEDTIRALGVGKWVVYNVVSLDSPEDIEKGVQLWQAPHQAIEDELSMLSIYTDEVTGEIVERPYDAPHEGWTVSIERTDAGYTGVGIFKQKEENRLSQDQWDALYGQAVCLDSVVAVKTYDELKELL